MRERERESVGRLHVTGAESFHRIQCRSLDMALASLPESLSFEFHLLAGSKYRFMCADSSSQTC